MGKYLSNAEKQISCDAIGLDVLQENITFTLLLITIDTFIIFKHTFEDISKLLFANTGLVYLGI